jgi:threonine aldolase
MIDYRSDTVTQPSVEMRKRMSDAPVGDDVFNEDPTVNELENYASQLLGFEDGLFCSSGTQTNQVAINVHVQPGGEIICHEETHIYKYEGGGIAKNSGASVRLLRGNRGRFTAKEASIWINPDDIHYPVTQLISLEDTSNRGGGAVYDFEEIKKIRALAIKNNIPLHLDGARVFNALIENKIDFQTYGKQFDTMSVCLSKGLGAPVGSVLLGNREFIKKARRVRKVFGGGMRQAGIIAAGGLFAIKNNIERLKIDHFHAKQLEDTLNSLAWASSCVPVETNIVVVELTNANDLPEIIEKLKHHNILAMPFGRGMIRFVTHLDITENDIHRTIESLKKLVI